jgi:hypothetical protein
MGAALGKGVNAFKKGLSGEEDLQASLGHKDEGVRSPDAVLPANEKKS